MNWEKHISNKYLVDYWFNKKTGESVWKKPNEVKELEEKEEKIEQEKQEKIEQARRERIKNLWRDYGPQMSSKTSNDKNNKYEMEIQNANGMTFTIEGKEHWSMEDYRDELRNINESLRDF
ncbi:MAG: hypothetical protein HN879_09665 [Flavobacteriaceae bacterium]|mgnify:CR=1 FL=1|jgi:hypothetical protein|nr:hypothetical protein [Flavobacteriaceae bacterium]